MAVQATLAWEEEGGHPRAQRGPVAGAATKFSHASSIGVFGFVPVWARSIFLSSRVVVRAWCLMPQSSAALLPVAVLCERARCARRAGWRARARCCSVAAAAAAAARVLRLSRWRARVAWRVRAWRLRGARAGRDGGVRLASCRMCGRVCAGSPVLFVHKRIPPPNNYFRLSPLCRANLKHLMVPTSITNHQSPQNQKISFFLSSSKNITL